MGIYVITHKYIDNHMPTSPFYRWLLVGAARCTDRQMGYLYDDSGSNISTKNKNYCELTGMYWIRHNCDEPIKGMVHYRRFFTKNIWSKKPKYLFTENEIKEILKQYDIVVGERMYIREENVAMHYEQEHYAKDLKYVRNALLNVSPEYVEAFDVAMKQRYMFPFNMLVASKEIFDAYADWLFTVLFEAEKMIDTSDYSEYQKRAYGFLAERMLNVWIIKNNVKYLELPIVRLDEKVKTKVRKILERKIKRPLPALSIRKN